MHLFSKWFVEFIATQMDSQMELGEVSLNLDWREWRSNNGKECAINIYNILKFNKEHSQYRDIIETNKINQDIKLINDIL